MRKAAAARQLPYSLAGSSIILQREARKPAGARQGLVTVEPTLLLLGLLISIDYPSLPLMES